MHILGAIQDENLRTKIVEAFNQQPLNDKDEIYLQFYDSAKAFLTTLSAPLRRNIRLVMTDSYFPNEVYLTQGQQIPVTGVDLVSDARYLQQVRRAIIFGVSKNVDSQIHSRQAIKHFLRETDNPLQIRVLSSNATVDQIAHAVKALLSGFSIVRGEKQQNPTQDHKRR